MKSLFNPADNQEIIDRINKLTKETLPDWGKMNVAEMLAHAQQPMKVALGELIIEPTFFGKFFGWCRVSGEWLTVGGAAHLFTHH